MYKNRKSGFTIVELLIVIVVIGILASITMVAYTGVQNRANTTKAQSNAKTIIDKVAVYYTEEGAYPANAAGLDKHPTSVIEDSTLKGKIGTMPTSGAKDSYGFTLCPTTGTTTGVRVTYWDYTINDTNSMTTGICP